MDEIAMHFKFRLYDGMLDNPNPVVTLLGHDSAIVITMDYPDDMPPQLSVTSSIMGESAEEVADNLEEIARTIRKVTAENAPIEVKVSDE